MNPLNLNHIKAERANSIKLRYRKFRKITNFFRVFEIFLVLAVISRVSFQLPLTIFKVSSEYFNNLSIILFSPQFVFLLGNAIVVTLFLNSGYFNSQYSNNMKTPKPSNQSNKGLKFEHRKKQNVTEDQQNTMMATIFSTPEHQVIRIYHRSKSEKLKREKVERACCSLRRSNTEVKRFKCSAKCCKDGKEGHYPEDHMNNDEFRKTIEDFIAKQQRFLREEEDFTPLC